MLRRFLLPLLCSLAIAHGAETQTFTIKTLPAQMKYDVTELNVEPGAEVKILFVNQDQMPHNLIFFRPGADAIAICNRQMENPAEALKRNYLPEDPAVWVHSKTLNPKEQEEIVFKAPDKPGVYPFACSMPGHAVIMHGEMKVFAPGPRLADLHFALYLGDWKQLPDFSQLKPHREGPVPDNLVQLKFDDYKNQYGVVFTGKLKAPSQGEYTFSLASDDGSRLLIDGKKVVEYDGIHPSNDIHQNKVKLAPGDHAFRLEYFQAAGESELFAGWKGPTFPTTPLSKWLPKNYEGKSTAKPKDNTTGIPLIVGSEPIIYRNFIEGAGDRGIGVGYPGNMNIAWSAEKMNLALVWRGAFIDAARHWRDRGGGAQPPLGYDVCHPGGLEGPPFAVLAAPGAPWPTLAKDVRDPAYAWKGYSLDKQRFPTFNYEWSGVKVSDRFDVEGDAIVSQGKLVRTLRLSGAIPAGALFRAASGTSLQATGQDFLVEAGSKFLVHADGARVEGPNLVIPARAEIKVTYTWPSPTGQNR